MTYTIEELETELQTNFIATAHHVIWEAARDRLADMKVAISKTETTMPERILCTKSTNNSGYWGIGMRPTKKKSVAYVRSDLMNASDVLLTALARVSIADHTHEARNIALDAIEKYKAQKGTK